METLTTIYAKIRLWLATTLGTCVWYGNEVAIYKWGSWCYVKVFTDLSDDQVDREIFRYIEYDLKKRGLTE